VDILRSQVEYAHVHYGTSFRRFLHVDSVAELASIDETFDCITLVEVIEHLDRAEAGMLLREISRKLKPGGKLVLTTPNYGSAWPVIELLLNRFSDVKYAEQHITRFRYRSVERELERIYPPLRDEFDVELKTTTHFVTPFLAWLSFRLAYRLSRLVPHRHWRLPFGSLILLVASRAERVPVRAAADGDHRDARAATRPSRALEPSPAPPPPPSSAPR
jgi:SAM-dependent methyltransferase